MVHVPFIDPHVHADSRSSEDFARLAAVGCQGVVAVAGAGAGYRGPDSLLDALRRLHLLDRTRIRDAGLRVWVALGIHPLGIPASGLERALAALPQALREYQADALGEVGLDGGGEREEAVLREQLALAASLGLPVIVHTPRTDKARLVRRTLDLLAGSGLPPDRVLVDHLDRQTLPEVLAGGWRAGLSVHPAKCSPAQAALLVAENPEAPLVLDTDLGANPSYLFGIPAALAALEEAGVPESVMQAAAYDRAAALLGSSR